jgi:hypothetical protein
VTDAEQLVADLDEELARDGQDIRLQRLTGTQQIPFEVTCRAFVRPVSAEQLIAGITQDSSNVVLSPTQIVAAGWPGPNSSKTPTTVDRRVPTNNDKVVIAGKVRQINAVMPVYADGELVRINLRVLG